MPQKGLSWFRIKEHFRKTWAIYIVGFVICAVLSNILFASTTPRTPTEQQILIYVADGYTDSTKLDEVAQDMLQHAQIGDETLLEVDFEDLSYSDPTEDAYSAMLLMTRLALNEGDAFLANSYCAETLMAQDYYLPLEDYIADGWLEGLELETVSATSTETGETHIAGIKLDNVNALAELGAFSNQDAVLIICYSSDNVETTMDAIEYMLRSMLEGKYASSESSES